MASAIALVAREACRADSATCPAAFSTTVCDIHPPVPLCRPTLIVLLFAESSLGESVSARTLHLATLKFWFLPHRLSFTYRRSAGLLMIKTAQWSNRVSRKRVTIKQRRRYVS